MMAELVVLTAGALSTIQDLGRPGRRGDGITPGGAADMLSLRVANLLVGNPPGAAAIEITLLGPRLTASAGVWVAVAGAELDVTLSGAGGESIAVPPVHPVWVPAGSTIVCGGARRGCRAILAVSGGIDVPVILGGRGTDARSAFGGFDGRPLRAGDRLALGPGRLPPPLEPARAKIVPRTVGEEFKPWQAGPVRVIRGPEFDAFDGTSQEAFLTAAFVVTGDSDRMGCRLAGPPLVFASTIRSQPVVPGTIQVPPSGQPILLLADAPTTGGYPRIAVVATVDLPCVAQARPGDRLHFEEISIHEATERLCDRERALVRLERGLEAGR